MLEALKLSFPIVPMEVGRNGEFLLEIFLSRWFSNGISDILDSQAHGGHLGGVQASSFEVASVLRRTLLGSFWHEAILRAPRRLAFAPWQCAGSYRRR